MCAIVGRVDEGDDDDDDKGDQTTCIGIDNIFLYELCTRRVCSVHSIVHTHSLSFAQSVDRPIRSLCNNTYQNPKNHLKPLKMHFHIAWHTRCGSRRSHFNQSWSHCRPSRFLSGNNEYVQVQWPIEYTNREQMRASALTHTLLSHTAHERRPSENKTDEMKRERSIRHTTHAVHTTRWWRRRRVRCRRKKMHPRHSA